MTRRGALHSIVVEHDTQGARALGAANDPDASVLVVQVAPDLRRRFELGWAILEALGKRDNVSGQGRHDATNWEVLHAWLIAHRIEQLILLDAQWLPIALIGDIAGLVATCNVDVWLIAHHPVADPYLDEVARWPHTDNRQRELVATIKAAAKHSPAPATMPNYPDVPTDNWPIFRWAARQQLDDDAFATVDATFLTAFEQARPMFDRNDLDELIVLAELRRQLHDCSAIGEMIAAVRGVQVAAHHGGWLLHAEPNRLIHGADAMSRTAIHNPDTWRRLRAYRLPYRGAAIAFTATDLTIGTMLDIECRHVSSDGTTVQIGGATHTLPTGADVFTRAQLTYRAQMGARPEDLLFADDDGPLRDRILADALRTPPAELGVPVIDLGTSRSREPVDKRWQQRWGIALQKLTS